MLPNSADEQKYDSDVIFPFLITEKTHCGNKADLSAKHEEL